MGHHGKDGVRSGVGSMISSFSRSSFQLCSHTPKKLLVPVATLGIVGFFINAHVLFLLPEDEGICLPKQNIVFLKTHKCAGSSIQNILMRYGEKHDLNFVLPVKGNYLGHPNPFNRSMVSRMAKRKLKFNILAHHTRFDRREIAAVMPRDTLYLTIVRDPAELFESSYYYYGLDNKFGADLHYFVNFLPRLEDELLMTRHRGRFGINQMYFDLGGDGSNNDTEIIRYLGLLDSWFDLVLVAERMDESLVLLRHLLCWDIDEVVTFRLNARSDLFKTNLTEKERYFLWRANKADYAIYTHFYNKFDREVEAFGRDRMALEVALLKQRTAEWYHLCVQGQQLNSGSTSKHYYNPRVMSFKTSKNNNTCALMTRNELDYTDILREKQMDKIFPKRHHKPRMVSKLQTWTQRRNPAISVH